MTGEGGIILLLSVNHRAIMGGKWAERRERDWPSGGFRFARGFVPATQTLLPLNLSGSFALALSCALFVGVAGMECCCSVGFSLELGKALSSHPLSECVSGGGGGGC